METARGDAAGVGEGALARWLGPPGSELRRWRILLALGLAALLAWLVGPYAAFRLPGDPTLVPEPGQSRIHTVLVGLWWAAVLNAALCALLLATSGVWARPLPTSPRPARAPARLGWGALLALAGAAALAGALRWPLAHGSLWWDEAWSVRHVIVGRVDPAADDPARLTFQPAPWLDTLFYYRAPTNHVAYSVAARGSLAVWRAATGADRFAFDEFALRLPAWLAALAAVVGVGWLVAELGFPVAAPAAALLLAVHPWHVRYGADGRGYSFVVALSIAGALLLLRALRDGRWRDLFGFAAAALALVWAFPLGVYVPASLGLAGAIAILAGAAGRAARGLRLARFAVANTMAGMAFLQLMAPNFAQAAAFQKEWSDPGGLAWPWVRGLWVALATGLSARAPRLPDVAFPTLATLAEARPWLRAAVLGLLPALAAFGLARAVQRGAGPERAAILGLAGAVPLFLLHRALQPFFLLARFAVYGVAAVVPLMVIGLSELVPARFGRAVRTTVSVAAVAAYAALVAPQLQVLLTRPVTPAREVAAFLAEASRGVPGGALRAGVGLGGHVPRAYDPWLESVEDVPGLVALCSRARAEARPLYLTYSYGPINEKRRPELFGLVLDRRLFEPVGRFDGIEAELVLRVLRYTGVPLEGANPPPVSGRDAP